MVMPSRRQRKRDRRSAARRPQPSLPTSGGQGVSVELWSNATRAELRLLAHSIRSGWPVPWHHRGPILDAVAGQLNAEVPLQALAVAHVYLAASQANLNAVKPKG